MRSAALAQLVQCSCLLGVLALTGCASVPSVPPQAWPAAAQTASTQRFARLQAVTDFALEAKLAVQYGGKGYTARLQWQHATQSDHLQIFSPLGQQVALIERTPAGVSLTDQRGQRHQADDVASLTEQLLGWRLPLTGLSQWILAAPHTGSPYQVSYSNEPPSQPAGATAVITPLPSNLTQDQWDISYEDYRATALMSGEEQLPYTTRLQQRDIRLKLVIQSWTARH